MNTKYDPLNRRDFIKSSGIAALSAAALEPGLAADQTSLAETAGLESALTEVLQSTKGAPSAASPVAGATVVLTEGALDLSPANWLWYPGDRTLPNTFVLFRRVLKLSEKPRKATGWIIGESRYQLEVNGRRIQWGPAPNDPRWPEVDPMDLTEALTKGENVLGATVLYFGQGDTTCPMSRAGFIFRLELEFADGRKELVVSDNSWRCHLSQAWKPGQHRMSFFRAIAGGVRRPPASARMERERLQGGRRLAGAPSSSLPGQPADLRRPDEGSDELDQRPEQTPLWSRSAL